MHDCVQGSTESIQHSNGLYNAVVRNVELRRGRHDRDPLEGSTAAAASVLDLHCSTDGPGFH